MKKMILVLVVLVIAGVALQAQHDHHGHEDHHAANGTAPQGVETGVRGTLSDLDFSEYEGRTVVVKTLAGWCVGCFPEIPAFVELQSDFADRDVVVVGVITQSAPEWTETFVDRYEVNYPVYHDMSGNDALSLFGTDSIPTGIYVYDESGELIESLGGFSADTVRETLETRLSHL